MKQKIKLVLLFKNTEVEADYVTFLTEKGRISFFPNTPLFYGSGKIISYSNNNTITQILEDTIFKFENNVLSCS